MIEQFENMTIAQLKDLHEQFGKCQELIEKQTKTIQKLKIKYPMAKDDDDFNAQEFLDSLSKEKK